MVYDKLRGHMVLFGGLNPIAGGPLFPNDTWVFDGDQWTQRTPLHSPSGRESHGMTFDEHRGVVVLFGGQSHGEGGARQYNDIWEWDGSDWRPVTPVGTPPGPRGDAGMAYDSIRRIHLIYGGYHRDSQERLGDTWGYDGTRLTWTPLDLGLVSPGPRFRSEMAFDAKREQVILSGGETRLGESFVLMNDTWIWDGHWRPHPAVMEHAVADHAMAYDDLHDVVWVSGGRTGVGYSPRTSAWNGVDYLCRFGGPMEESLCRSPIRNTPYSVYGSFAMGYDIRRQRLTAFVSRRVPPFGSANVKAATYVLTAGNMRPENHVDWRNTVSRGDGSAANPFASVRDAVLCASDDSAVYIQSGTYADAPVSLRRRVTVVPLNGVVTIR